MKNFILLLGCALLCFNLSNAQEEERSDNTTIKGQFETLVRKSTNYRQGGKRYEVVRLLELEAFQKNILDTISAANDNISELQATIADHETTLSSLNTKLEQTTKNLTELTAEKDSMSFFGIMVSKGTYKLIVWCIIFGLLIFLILFIYKFKNSNTLTQQAKLALSDVEGEFEEHRRRALEREQKISRKLQDEINKKKGV
ncbi:tRNA (guanine-N1)-methyltransferase [Croceitalea rosinachiae]|uniref:tRNA (Guanine-N1)-methyltransferase n=1 Tax=Croceitalea rosinachiae TaxID=3075596 RepID=A0ABU3AB97_9FLAO|nr:tRNA (guanine-N1)-methyltransferase [Croceitalea sp. F388]MDT0607244.1 tRNA (guanine-N1)-methyltransferase [Croceitalea sp. F388]